MSDATAQDETQLTLNPQGRTEIGAPKITPTGDPITDLINRVSSDPNASIETLERVIALRDREQDAAAKRAFNVAFSDAQRDMPAVPKRGKGYSSDYALWEDVNQRIIRCLSEHELSISYTSEFEPDAVLVTATLRHSQGHSIEGQFYSPIESPVNKSGKPSMNKAQSRGSAMTYGKRYATINLLSLTTHGEDDDAFASGASGAMMPHLDAIADAMTMADMAQINNNIKRDQIMTGQERNEVISTYKVKYSAINSAAKAQANA